MLALTLKGLEREGLFISTNWPEFGAALPVPISNDRSGNGNPRPYALRSFA